MDLERLLSQIFANLARNATDVATGLVESGAQKLIDLYKKDFRSYLENMLKRCSFVKTIISRDEPVLLLSIYVAPRLRCGNRFFDERLFIKAIKQRKRALIVGTAGSGKSMFLRCLFLSLVENNEGRIPLFVELRQINDTSENDLGSFIKGSILNPGAVVTDEQFKAGLSKGLFTLVLDGFDEIDHDRRPPLQQQLLAFQEKYPETIIVVSSRPDERLNSWIPFSTFQILPMDMPRAISLVSKVNYDRPLKAKFVRAMKDGLFAKHKSFLSNPLLALMMLMTYDQYAHIPEKKHIFYEHAFDALFFKHDASKYGGYRRKTYTGLAIDDFKNCFSSFCILTYMQKKLSFSDTEIRSSLKKALHFERLDVDLEKFINDLVESICMLQRDGMSLTFSHRSFQEFFSAFFITRSPAVPISKLLDQISPRHSDNVVPMLYSMNRTLIEREWVIPNLSKLVRTINDIDMRNYFYKYLKVYYDEVRALWNGNAVIFEVDRSLVGHFRFWLGRLYPEVLSLGEGDIRLDHKHNQDFLNIVRKFARFGDKRVGLLNLGDFSARAAKISPGFKLTLWEGDSVWLQNLGLRDILENDRLLLNKLFEHVQGDMSFRQNVLGDLFE